MEELNLLMVVAGGGLGAALRYGLAGFVYRTWDGAFPWGTLCVNLLGCLAAGFLWGVLEDALVSPEIRTFLFIGFFGSFTTLSTFGVETFALLRDGEFWLAFLNLVLTAVGGLVAVCVGYFASQGVVALLQWR